MDFRELVRKKNLSYQWYERQAIARQRAMTKRGVVPIWLACHTQAEIAERVGLTREAVTMFLQKMSKEYQENQIDIFRNFDPQIYTHKNFYIGAIRAVMALCLATAL